MSERENTDNPFTALQLAIVKVIESGGITTICGYEPRVFEAGWPVLYDPNHMSRDQAIDADVRCGLSLGNGEVIPVRGSSLFKLEGTLGTGDRYVQIVPGFVQAGNLFLVPVELHKALSQSVPSIADQLVGISRVDQLFGPYPESAYAASMSALIDRSDLEGCRVIEFGASSGNQLLIAAKSGVTHGLGIDLPGFGGQYTEVLRSDLVVNGYSSPENWIVIDHDILEYGADEVDCIKSMWQQRFHEVALPNVAIINLGPSYDVEIGGDVLSPHQVALQQAIHLGVQRVLVGGLALVYVDGGRGLSKEKLAQIRQSDEIARELLRRHFSKITMLTLRNGMQVISAER